jgi:hypothetical protein
LEFLFDDGSDTPWSLYLAPDQVDHMPRDSDTNGMWTLTVWIHRLGERGQYVLETPCYYRRSPQLPDLRPWQP